MRNPHMRPIRVTVFRNFDANDARQVPAAGAEVVVALQGATVRLSAVINSQTEEDVTVYALGRIAPGCQVIKNWDDSQYYWVSNVDFGAYGPILTIANENQQPLTLAPGDRLVVYTPSLALFADSEGVTQLNGFPHLNANGVAGFYCPEPLVDYFVRGGGLTSPRMDVDVPSGYIDGATPWFDVRDYRGIQEAIDALPSEGGTVFIPAGQYTLTNTLYTPCDRPCNLIGESSKRTDHQLGTVLTWATGTPGTPVDMLRVRGDGSGGHAVRRLQRHRVGTQLADHGRDLE